MNYLYSLEGSNFENDPGFTTLVSALEEQTSSAGIAVLGSNGSAIKLVEKLEKTHLGERLIGHFDKFNEPGKPFHEPLGGLYDHRHEYDILVINSPTDRHRDHFRYIIHDLKISCDIIIPGNKTMKWPLDYLEKSSRPILISCPPTSGSNRLMPSIRMLLTALGWKEREQWWLQTNSRYINQYRDDSGELTILNNDDATCEAWKNDINMAFYWNIRALKPFEFIVVHDHNVDVSRFADLDCSIVLLMRDPRDVLNSYTFYHKGLSPEQLEQRRLELLHRKVTGRADYVFIWPGVKELAENHIRALNQKNVNIVRFEDLVKDPVDTLRHLLESLELTPNAFLDVTKNLLSEAAHLGSFEYQTGGKRKRGDDHTFRYVEPGKVNTSCRKGIVGDWKNHFSEKVIEQFKKLAGDDLITLGYESPSD